MAGRGRFSHGGALEGRAGLGIAQSLPGTSHMPGAFGGQQHKTYEGPVLIAEPGPGEQREFESLSPLEAEAATLYQKRWLKLDANSLSIKERAAAGSGNLVERISLTSIQSVKTHGTGCASDSETVFQLRISEGRSPLSHAATVRDLSRYATDERDGENGESPTIRAPSTQRSLGSGRPGYRVLYISAPSRSDRNAWKFELFLAVKSLALQRADEMTRLVQQQQLVSSAAALGPGKGGRRAGAEAAGPGAPSTSLYVGSLSTSSSGGLSGLMRQGTLSAGAGTGGGAGPGGGPVNRFLLGPRLNTLTESDTASVASSDRGEEYEDSPTNVSWALGGFPDVHGPREDRESSGSGSGSGMVQGSSSTGPPHLLSGTSSSAGFPSSGLGGALLGPSLPSGLPPLGAGAGGRRSSVGSGPSALYAGDGAVGLPSGVPVPPPLHASNSAPHLLAANGVATRPSGAAAVGVRLGPAARPGSAESSGTGTTNSGGGRDGSGSTGSSSGSESDDDEDEDEARRRRRPSGSDDDDVLFGLADNGLSPIEAQHRAAQAEQQARQARREHRHKRKAGAAARAKPLQTTLVDVPEAAGRVGGINNGLAHLSFAGHNSAVLGVAGAGAAGVSATAAQAALAAATDLDNGGLVTPPPLSVSAAAPSPSVTPSTAAGGATADGAPPIKGKYVPPHLRPGRQIAPTPTVAPAVPYPAFDDSEDLPRASRPPAGVSSSSVWKGEGDERYGLWYAQGYLERMEDAHTVIKDLRPSVVAASAGGAGGTGALPVAVIEKTELFGVFDGHSGKLCARLAAMAIPAHTAAHPAFAGSPSVGVGTISEGNDCDCHRPPGSANGSSSAAGGACGNLSFQAELGHALGHAAEPTPAPVPVPEAHHPDGLTAAAGAAGAAGPGSSLHVQPCCPHSVFHPNELSGLALALHAAFLAVDGDMQAKRDVAVGKEETHEANSGCTAMAMALRGPHLLLAYVGDCRAVLAVPDARHAYSHRDAGHGHQAGHALGHGAPDATASGHPTSPSHEPSYKAVELTRDHTPQAELGRIRLAGGWVSCDRDLRFDILHKIDPKLLADPVFKHRIEKDMFRMIEKEIGRVNSEIGVSRALGDLEYKEPAMHQHVWDWPKAHVGPREHKRGHSLVLAEPGMMHVRLPPSNTPGRPAFVILACDGLWDALSAEEAAQIAGWLMHERAQARAQGGDGAVARLPYSCLGDPSGPEGDAMVAARRLVELAIKLGSQDNVTAMVVRL